MAVVTHHADTAEGENADVESYNGLARRRVKAALQQKKLDMTDLNTYMTFGQAKSECGTLWGLPLPEVKEPAAATDEAPKMKAGGGGLQRSFFSKFHGNFRDEDGKLNMADANKAYNDEKAKSDSAVLAELRDDARRGTLAYREAFKAHGSFRGAPMSSFGRVRRQSASRLQTQEETKLVLQDMQSVINAKPVASVLDIVAVCTQQDALSQVLSTYVQGGTTDAQVLLKRVARLDACQKAKERREQEAEVRTMLAKPPEMFGLDKLAPGELPKTGALRAIPGELPRLEWADPCVDVAASAVAALRRKRGTLCQRLASAFENWACLIRHNEQPTIKLTADFRPSPCYTHGLGTCLCSAERGWLVNIAKRSFANALCLLCPAKSKLRNLLTNTWIIAYFPEDRIWVSIAVMYYNPRRPTFIRLEDNGCSRWGRTQLDVVYRPSGQMAVHLDAAFFSDWNLAMPQTVQLFKMCSFDRLVADFTPDRNLLIERLNPSLLSGSDSVQWWPGTDAVFKKIDDEKRKKNEERLRREARKTQSEKAASKRKQESSHRRRQTKRRVSASGDESGNALLCLTEGSEEDPDDGSEADFWAKALFPEKESESEQSELGCGFGEAVLNDMALAQVMTSGHKGNQADDGDDLFASGDRVDELLASGSSDDSPVLADGPLEAPQAPEQSNDTPKPPSDNGGDSPSYVPTSPANKGGDSPAYVPTSPAAGEKSPSFAPTEAASDADLSQDLSNALEDLMGAEAASDADLAKTSSSSSSSRSSSSSSSSAESGSDGAGEREGRFLEQFGPFVLRKVYEGQEFIGVRILCGKHTNTAPDAAAGPVAGPQCNPCMRGIHFGKTSPLTEDECKLRCKRWACWGFTIEQDCPTGRRKHHRRAPRSFHALLSDSDKARIPAHLFPDGSLDGL